MSGRRRWERGAVLLSCHTQVEGSVMRGTAEEREEEKGFRVCNFIGYLR